MSNVLPTYPTKQDDDDDGPPRHPLGLPRGSVRAVLSLLILAQFWLLILAPKQLTDGGPRLVPMPWYLYCLLGLVFVFFASHGGTIAWAEDPEPSPLWLRGGVLRILMLLTTIGLLGWQLYTDPDGLKFRLEPNPKETGRLPYLLFILVAGYGLGWISSRIFTALELNKYLQDIQASVSLVAILLLLIGLVWFVFIQPQLDRPFEAQYLEYTVTAVVAWYFGVRS